MRKQFLIAIGFVISTAASAQEWRPSIEKWRSSADARPLAIQKVLKLLSRSHAWRR
jgi:hypothetical protein